MCSSFPRAKLQPAPDFAIGTCLGFRLGIVWKPTHIFTSFTIAATATIFFFATLHCTCSFLDLHFHLESAKIITERCLTNPVGRLIMSWTRIRWSFFFSHLYLVFVQLIGRVIGVNYEGFVFFLSSRTYSLHILYTDQNHENFIKATCWFFSVSGLSSLIKHSRHNRIHIWWKLRASKEKNRYSQLSTLQQVEPNVLKTKQEKQSNSS